MTRLLADFSIVNKGGRRVRMGLAPRLAEAAAARGWTIHFTVRPGTTLDVDRPVRVLPPRSDLVLEHVELPRLMAGYDVVFTERECLRLPGRYPRTVLQLHEHQHTRYVSCPTPRQAAREAVAAYRASRMYRLADHICFSSGWTRDEFRRLEGFEPSSCSTVPLGGWPDDLVIDHHRERAPRIVVVGSPDVRDDLDWALRVWQRAQLPDPWELVVIGQAPPIAAERVRTPGWLSDAALVDLLAGARVYLHSGRVEGFGLSIVEALQAGTPVVARHGSAVDELLRVGGGRLVDGVADAALAVNELAAGAISPAAALATGSRYRWAHTAEAIASACEMTLKSGRRAR